MTQLSLHQPALRILLDSEDVAVCVRAGDVEVCNAAACRLLGVERDALARRSLFDFSPPIQPDGTSSAEGVRRRMESASAGLPQWFQWRFRRSNGELVVALIHLESVQSGGHDYLVARVRNVSHLWHEAILRDAALAVSGAEGPDIFGQLVRSLATILKTDLAWVSVFVDNSGERLRTVALFVDGQIVPNVEYLLPETPCADVVGREFRYYSAQVRSRFPADSMVAGLGIESYAGYPLNDAAGVPLGNVVVMSRSPLAGAELTESMLKVFAVRAAAEIERGRAEAALRAREEQYRAIFNASVDGLLLKDSDHRIIDVNEAFLSMHGYRRDALIGQRLSDFIPAALQARCDELLPGILAGEPCHIEARTQRRDGSLFDVEIHGVPMRYRGRPHALVIMRDITEHKLAEQRLRASEEQYRAIFNASADALMLWNSRLQRVDVNPAHETIFGFAREDVVGRGFEGLLYPEEFARPRIERVRRALAGEVSRVELEALRKDGQRIITELRTIPFLHRGEPHVLQIARDITERRRADEERARLEFQLRQAQKMEAIGHLAGGIAHDFNNVLTSIMGYIALATERDAAAGDDKLAKYLQQANVSCQRARDLIQQILIFSRGRKSERQPTNLARVVRESTNLLRSSLPATLELVCDLDADAPPAMLDPVQAEQVLLNLCINARDATGGSGTVHVTVGCAALDGVVCASCRQAVRGEFVELGVRDNGSGIAPAVMERMFEPFFSTKEVGKGSGMGLSTVHGIVHEHGGHVLVEGASGHGAIFRVLFPALERETGDAGADASGTVSNSASGASLHGEVLVVDDEAMVGEFMRDLLESWGLRVTIAANAGEAREMWAREPQRFDAVITDQTMPRMTGLDFARELLGAHPGVPVIIYTGYADGLTEAEVRNAGALALVRKPLEPRALRTLLESALAARGQLKE